MGARNRFSAQRVSLSRREDCDHRASERGCVSCSYTIQFFLLCPDGYQASGRWYKHGNWVLIKNYRASLSLSLSLSQTFSKKRAMKFCWLILKPELRILNIGGKWIIWWWSFISSFPNGAVSFGPETKPGQACHPCLLLCFTEGNSKIPAQPMTARGYYYKTQERMMTEKRSFFKDQLRSVENLLFIPVDQQ